MYSTLAGNSPSHSTICSRGWSTWRILPALFPQEPVGLRRGGCAVGLCRGAVPWGWEVLAGFGDETGGRCEVSPKRDEDGRTTAWTIQSAVTARLPRPGLFTPRPLRCSLCSTAFIYGYLVCAHSGVKICAVYRNYKSRHSLWPLSISITKIIILELVFTQNQAATHQSIISLRPTNKHQTGTSFKSLWTWTNFETLP